MLPLRPSHVHALARGAAVVALLAPMVLGPATHAAASNEYAAACSRGSFLCPDVSDSAETFGRYIGHDEPSVLFYSDVAGSGNSTRYQLRLPEEASVKPTDAGTGGTFNFQLHPAFWVGMALCDTESSPNPGTKACAASSDANIFDGIDPAKADYVG